MKLIDKISGSESVSVVAYGDSWTYGSCADGWLEAKSIGGDAERIYGSWVLQMRRHLQEINAKVTVHNSGRGGWTSRQGVEGYGESVSPFNADMLILNFGINDWRHGVSLNEFRDNISQIVDRNGAAGAACLIWASGPVSARSGLDHGWHAPLDDRGFPNLFSDYNGILREVALAYKTHFVDVEQEILKVWKAGACAGDWFEDAFHFNQLGHNEMYKIIAGCMLSQNRVTELDG